MTKSSSSAKSKERARKKLPRRSPSRPSIVEGSAQSQAQVAEEQLAEEQKSVDFDTKEFTIETLISKYEKGSIYVPEYQRNLVWDFEKKCRLIESLLLGFPIPFMFGADNASTGKIELVDGRQRLGTVHEYIKGELKLDDLDRLNHMDGLGFADLSDRQQERFLNRTIRMVVLSQRTEESTRFDIFDRINSGSMRLTGAEMRRGAYQGPFYDLVEELSTNEQFVELCPLGTKLISRRENEELVLRFFAYTERYLDFQHYVAKFLNEYLKDQNVVAEQRPQLLERCRVRFMNVMKFAKHNFPAGFAKKKTDTNTPRVRFEALSVGTALALEKRKDLKPKSLDWLESEEFQEQTTTHASNSGPRLRARVEYVRDQLLS